MTNQIGFHTSALELNRAAVRAMSQGDFVTAQRLLHEAISYDGGNANLWLNLAASLRASSDFDGAMAVLEKALALEPRSFMGLLMKASLLEHSGQIARAAVLYGAAIGLAQPDDRLDAATLAALTHGREVHRRHVVALSQFIGAEISALRERGTSAEAKRINGFIDLTVNRKRRYQQEPTELFYPGLPAVEFYERDEFPWLEEFEQAAPAMREELLGILRSGPGDFVPYINYPDSVPLDQWAELNRSRRWSALHLYHYGEAVVENTSRCPNTMAALSPVPQANMPRRSPAAMFSALQPKTHIPPHTGVANTRLVVHLPLIVPEGCAFRVGNETRSWREGKGWVFDDTIEHEAWNTSELLRVIFICDIWNPLISAAERECINAVVSAMDRFESEAPKFDL